MNENTHDLDQLLTDRQVAEILNISLQTLRTNRHHKKGLPIVRLGRSIRYRAAEVKKYIAENTQTFD